MPTIARPATRRLLAFALAAMLVALQAIGAAHRVLHAPGLAHADETALFAGHDDGDCQVFDALAAGDAAAGAPTIGLATDAGVSAPVPVHPGWHVAAQAAGFLARGPPILG